MSKMFLVNICYLGIERHCNAITMMYFYLIKIIFNIHDLLPHYSFPFPFPFPFFFFGDYGPLFSLCISLDES
jgi:hypothetical protein